MVSLASISCMEESAGRLGWLYDGEVKYRFLSLLNQIMRLNVGMYCAGYRPEWAGSLYVKGSKHY